MLVIQGQPENYLYYKWISLKKFRPPSCGQSTNHSC